MIKIHNNRSVFPNSVKISNQYENDTRSIDFDLEDVQFTGNTYLICKYQNEDEYYVPLLLDSNNSVPVKTFLSQKDGIYECLIVISNVEIDENYDFSNDNPLFVSNLFNIYISENYLNGTAKQWELSPEMKNYYDRLITLVDKVQEDLDNGSFIGNGIKNIIKNGSMGLVDTYQILFTDGLTFDFQVTNGATPTITIQDDVWFVNGISTGVSALGQKGDKGGPGVGIVSIEKTSTSGNVDTYTITFTNQTTSTFTVTNGMNGKDGVTPNIQIGNVSTLPAGSQATATITGTPENPILNLGIPEGETGGITNYNELENKPQINGVELSGNQSGNDIGLVNNQQGTANAGKVLGIGQDGLVVPVENAGADNIIYKDVPKQLNPNVTDSFQRAMWNLKLYGQSTQGADPSPTNKQDITAISKFEGTAAGENLLSNTDFRVQNIGDPIIPNNGQLSFLANYILMSPINLPVGTYYFTRKFTDSSLNSNNEVRVRDSFNIVSTDIATCARVNETTFKVNIKKTNIPLYITINTPYDVEVTVYDIGIFKEYPFIYVYRQPQSFTYTPTQNMCSTLDGSIADYVDVEKGVEVYTMGGEVIDGSGTTVTPFGNPTVGYGFYKNVPNMVKQTNGVGWCDKAKVGTTGSYGATPTISFGSNNSVIYVTGIFTEQKTKEEIIAWLSENPLFIVYPLATPTEIPIDPEQLQMLRALYTYTGVTNFLCNAPVSFTYERSLQIVINNLENAIGQTNANILLGGNN